MKIIIAGSRDFNNYELLRDRLNYLLKDVSNKDEITMYQVGKRCWPIRRKICQRKGYKIIRKLANWNKYGKSAGYKRNEEMAKIADACVCLGREKPWD